MTLAKGPEAVAGEDIAIQDWNKRLQNLTSTFKTKHEGVQTFVHDTHDVYAKVLKDPAVFPQTSGLKNTTGFCKAYAKYVQRLQMLKICGEGTNGDIVARRRGILQIRIARILSMSTSGLTTCILRSLFITLLLRLLDSS